MEWKPDTQDLGNSVSNPLETSLVEWKLAVPAAGDCAPDDLGNFLSGMETGGEG